MWNHFLGAMPTPPCPICGASVFTPGAAAIDHLVTHRRFNLLDCTSCGFRVTSPQPSEGEIGQYYISDKYLSHNTKRPSFLGFVYRLLRRLTIRAKSNLVNKISPFGPVLDIGCGTGDLLAEMKRRGRPVLGVEPSALARSQSESVHGLRVFQGLAAVPPDSRFAAIMLWHVLEHLSDLSATLSVANKMLSKDGALYIAVPNRGSIDCAFYGSNWAAWDVPRHFWHFRTEDIIRLLSKHGFHVLHIRRMWLDAFYIALLSERNKGRSAWLAWPVAVIIGIYSNLMALFWIRPSSSTLFIAKKANSPVA